MDKLTVHICTNTDWGGAETRALARALAYGDGATVLCASSAKEVRRRMSAAGVPVIGGKFTGWFASLNLSRIFRHLPQQGLCRIYVHTLSAEVLNLVTKSVELSGREDLTVYYADMPLELPPHPVTPPQPDATPILMWLGRITPECGLAELIEALGRLTDRPWQLKVVGHGQAKTVMPLVNRTRALGMAERVEWTGYADDVYAHMHGVHFGVVTRKEPEQRTVTVEFGAAGVPVICGSDAGNLYKELSTRI